MAAGSNWQGEARLFRTSTHAWEWNGAVALSPKSKPVIGSPMEAAEIATSLAPDAFRTR